MSSRRNKPVPPPILAPPPHNPHDRSDERSPSTDLTEADAWSRSGTHKLERSGSPVAVTPGSSKKMGRGSAHDDGSHRSKGSTPQQSHLQRQQRAVSAASEAPPVYFLPSNVGAAGVPPIPSQVSVQDGKGLGANEAVLLERQATNTRSIIDLVQVNYGDAMRGYRVCKQGLASQAWLRLFGANDMVLLALAVSFLLSCIVTSNGLVTHQGDPLASKANRQRRVGEVLSSLNTDMAQLRGELEESFFFKVRLALCVLCFLLVLIRFFFFSLQRIYVEEVIAIRGVGLQLTDYGVFNQIKRRRFIDMKLIRSLVIHDAFFRYQPIFFLSSSIENESKRVVFFAETLPRLSALQVVLRGLRHVLYGEEEMGPSLSEIQQMQSSLQAQQVLSDDDTYTRSDESAVEGSLDFHSRTQFSRDYGNDEDGY